MIHLEHLMQGDAPCAFREIILPEEETAAYSAMAHITGDFGLHALTVDDCVRRNQRPKIESYESYCFLVCHLFHPRMKRPIELHLICTLHQVVLLSTESVPNFGSDGSCLFSHGKSTWESLLFSKKTSANWTFRQRLLALFEAVIDSGELWLQGLGRKIDGLEKRIVGCDVDPRRILRLKKKMRIFESRYHSLDALLERLDSSLVHPEDRLQFRNVRDHFLRSREMSITLRGQLMALLDVLWGASGLRGNGQMHRLSVLATVFFPLSLWSGIFGMNFSSLPFDKPWFLQVGISLMLANFLAVAIYLWRRGAFRSRQVRARRRVPT